MTFIFSTKVVFKNINFRLTAVLIFVASSLIVWNWQSYTETTPTRFLVQLQPEPETIIQNRNLSIYDSGGRVADCFNNLEITVQKCELSKKQARDFIFKHWQDKKRAYIILEFNSVDSFSDFHVFIEPDSSGKWHIIWRKEFSGFLRGLSKNIVNKEITSIEYKVAAKKDYYYKTGIRYLIFFDVNGEQIASL